METTLKPGGIIGCVGWDFTSNLINLFTLGVPGVSIHHVGIVSEHRGRPLIYEATKSERPVCVRTGRRVAGVQAHTLAEMRAIPFYSKLWYYPLRRELYLHERSRLAYYLESILGTPYDTGGAAHSGGVIFSALSALCRGENLAKLFCSETDVAALVATGLMQARNASRWNPNKLCRYLVRKGICNKPVRLK